MLALGFIRAEVIERNETITYDGGVATALAARPTIQPATLSLPDKSKCQSALQKTIGKYHA